MVYGVGLKRARTARAVYNRCSLGGFAKIITVRRCTVWFSDKMLNHLFSFSSSYTCRWLMEINCKQICNNYKQNMAKQIIGGLSCINKWLLFSNTASRLYQRTRSWHIESWCSSKLCRFKSGLHVYGSFPPLLPYSSLMYIS